MDFGTLDGRAVLVDVKTGEEIATVFHKYSDGVIEDVLPGSKTKLPLNEIYNEAHELKVIISNNHDFKFAEEQAAKVNANCELYLQPEWSKREKMTPLIVEFVMKNPHWKISLQTHKYLNIP